MRRRPKAGTACVASPTPGVTGLVAGYGDERCSGRHQQSDDAAGGGTHWCIASQTCEDTVTSSS